MSARMWKRWNHVTLLVGIQTDAAILENSMEVPHQIKNRATHNPAIALLGIYLPIQIPLLGISPKNTKVQI